MDAQRKEQFLRLWEKYFTGAELPIAFWYTDQTPAAELVKPPAGHRCMFADLAKVRKGQSLYFDASSFGCFGGKRYAGYSDEVMPKFEHMINNMDESFLTTPSRSKVQKRIAKNDR